MVPVNPCVMFKVHFVYEHLPEGLEKPVLMDKLRIVCSLAIYKMADLAVTDCRNFHVGVCNIPGVTGYLCVIGGPLYDAFDLLEYEYDSVDADDRAYGQQDILNELKGCFEHECRQSEWWAKYLDWIRDHIYVEPVCNKFAYAY